MVTPFVDRATIGHSIFRTGVVDGPVDGFGDGRGGKRLQGFADVRYIRNPTDVWTLDNPAIHPFLFAPHCTTPN